MTPHDLLSLERTIGQQPQTAARGRTSTPRRVILRGPRSIIRPRRRTYDLSKDLTEIVSRGEAHVSTCEERPSREVP